MEIKLFLEEHVELVQNFELGRLPQNLSEIQREMTSWEKPWRKESLAHYSQLGWSFVAEDKGEILGYTLGQPLLFFNNWTQSLWVEHCSYKDEEVGFQLLDTSIRWAKTKHLQKVIMNAKSDSASFACDSFPKFQDGSYFHLSTTKISEEG